MKNKSYIGISFIILVFGIIFIPKIINRIKEDDVTSGARGGETTHSKKKQTDASSFAASDPPANNSLVRNQKTTHRQLRHCEPQRKREQEERDIDGVGPHLEGENFPALVGGIGEKRQKQKKECVKS